MALQKQSLPINFAGGLDLKTDPFQVQPGKFLSLENSVFSKGGLLQKRNGNAALASLPDATSTYTTTYGGNLLALGDTIQAYDASNNVWIDKGIIQNVDVNITPIVRSATNQIQADSAIAANGLVCTVFTDSVPVSGSLVSQYKYTVTNQTTGLVVISPTLIPAGSGTITGAPRVFLLKNYFIVVFTNDISGTYHLQYIAISTVSPATVSVTGNISSQYTPASTVAFDGVVTANGLYLAWNGNDGGGAVRVAHLNSALSLSNVSVFTGYTATMFTVCADETGASPIIYVSFYSPSTAYTLAVNTSLVTVLAPTQILSSGTILNLASAAQDAVCSVIFEVSNAYGYDSTVATNYTEYKTISQSGTVSSATIVDRSVGLASKAFLYNAEIYFLAAYSSTFQPSYFLLNLAGEVISRIAYENGGGYLTTGLPSANVAAADVYIAYLYKDLIQAINKTQGIPNAAGVYSQLGVNIVDFTFTSTTLTSAEIGGSLNLSGGFMRGFDGASITENNFFLFPEDLEATQSPIGGGLDFQQYFYVATYERQDAQGNTIRSAPSIPLEVDNSLNNYTTVMSVFSSGASTIVVNSVAGLVIGQTVTDFTTPGNITGGTTITAINVGSKTLTLSTPTAGNSASTPGDTLHITTGVQFTSVFAANVSSIVVSSTTGLLIGQILTDVTTGANISAGTYITSINTGTSTIGLSLPTAAASATSPGDTLQTVTTASNTINIPTDRLTYSTSSKVVLYRWSTAQQIYYQVTSIQLPLLNDTTIDYVTFTDTQGDGAILGNNILYTTGGVVENISPPPLVAVGLYKSRLVGIDAEDRNTAWFSKQVIENTPVEMSDLFTVYVSPTISSEGSTGVLRCVSALDDKWIFFKDSAIYYVTGTGPNNTGDQDDFSDPVFITSTVGCANQKSIVFTPNGLMFQSSKGIWLLGRDLSTSYIGAPVETYNSAKVLSAVNIPTTNYVLFTLDSGVTLMYDYYFNQWGSFVNMPGVSSTLYQNLHTYINSFGEVFQETPGKYLDGAQPVLMAFTTAWLSLAGVQGFERAYFFSLLANYISPHKLNVQIAYDYVSSIAQSTIITPDNYSGVYGGNSPYGASSPFGGISTLEQWRIFFRQQKCRTFQITINEIFDPSFGTVAGAGFTMSGLNVIIGGKGNYPRIKTARQAG